MNFATFNCREMKTNHKSHHLAEDMARYKVSVMAVPETNVTNTEAEKFNTTFL